MKKWQLISLISGVSTFSAISITALALSVVAIEKKQKDLYLVDVMFYDSGDAIPVPIQTYIANQECYWKYTYRDEDSDSTPQNFRTMNKVQSLTPFPSTEEPEDFEVLTVYFSLSKQENTFKLCWVV